MNFMQKAFLFLFFTAASGLYAESDPFLSLLAAKKNDAKKVKSTKKTAARKKIDTKLTRDEIEQLDFRYINQLEYQKGCNHFPEINESQLSIVDRKNREKYQQLIEEGYEAPWYVQYVNDKVGYGAFAADDIEAGQLIAEYTGVIYDQEYHDQHQPIDSKYMWTLPAPSYFKDPSLRFLVDAKPVGNFVRFVNHSYHPNVQGITVYCEHDWHMIYVATRAIKQDEQLLVDYGRGYWSQRNEPEEMSTDV